MRFRPLDLGVNPGRKLVGEVQEELARALRIGHLIKGDQTGSHVRADLPELQIACRDGPQGGCYRLQGGRDEVLAPLEVVDNTRGGDVGRFGGVLAGAADRSSA